MNVAWQNYVILFTLAIGWCIFPRVYKTLMLSLCWISIFFSKREIRRLCNSKNSTRCSGMLLTQVYQPESGLYKEWDKYFGRRLRADGFKTGLHDFLDNGVRFLHELIPDILSQLRQLSEVIHRLEGFRFYSSSLLIMYEGMPENHAATSPTATMSPSNTGGLVDVKMIDFAHSCLPENTANIGHRGPDSGYLFGLTNLIALLEELMASPVPASWIPLVIFRFSDWFPAWIVWQNPRKFIFHFLPRGIGVISGFFLPIIVIIRIRMHWSSNWLIDWSFSRLIDWLIDHLVDRLIDWLIIQLIDWLIDWSFNWLIDWSSSWLIGTFLWRQLFFSGRADHFFVKCTQNFRHSSLHEWMD